MASAYSNRMIWATLPRTERGKPLVLGGDPKGKKFLYTNGHSVIIRDIAEPSIADIYTEHSVATTVAKYSPSGFYIASGDQSGKIRIWDTINKEHILKNEFQPLSGDILDLAWSSDSQRIVVVGKGRERFGHVIMAETGTSVGEIGGHSNLINSCDFRPKRPFRIITGSEDNSVGIFEGPPFKFTTTIADHNRFVQSVRYAPNGDIFASGGFDGKMFLYNASDYSKVGEFGDPQLQGEKAHGGGIYSVSWLPDSKRILSASGDKTCKLWDAETLSLISTFTMGNDVLDQQVSCLCQADYLLSVSLSGFINYLDVNNPSKPLRVIQGHNKSITAIALDPSKETLYTGSHDGFITSWNVETGSQERISGCGHTNQVQGMAPNDVRLYTCAFDDTVKSVSYGIPKFESLHLKFDSQPRGVSAGKDELVMVACLKEIVVVRSGQKIVSLPAHFEPSCISLFDEDVAVGGAQDSQVHIFKLSGNTLTEKKTMTHTGAITDVAFSPNGAYLAASDANRKVVLYDAKTYEPAHSLDWCFHTARVNCIGWSPDSLHLATGSLDTNIIVWYVEKPSKHIIIKKAHPQSQITRVAWLSENCIISTGQDSNVKVWDITY